VKLGTFSPWFQWNHPIPAPQGEVLVSLSVLGSQYFFTNNHTFSSIFTHKELKCNRNLTYTRFDITCFIPNSFLRLLSTMFVLWKARRPLKYMLVFQNLQDFTSLCPWELRVHVAQFLPSVVSAVSSLFYRQYFIYYFINLPFFLQTSKLFCL
jgi:hypothetical protein